MYEKVRTLNEQLKSEEDLPANTTFYIMDKYDEMIGTVINFYPQDRYNHADIIGYDVNGSRFILSYHNFDDFLETYSPEDKELLELDDVFIVTKSSDTKEIESILSEFNEIAFRSREGLRFERLMANEIRKLRSQLYFYQS